MGFVAGDYFIFLFILYLSSLFNPRRSGFERKRKRKEERGKIKRKNKDKE
jgi:hypothetical protein